MASCNENVDEDHSFILRLIIATGDLTCDIDACAYCLHSVCIGSAGEAGCGGRDHGDVLWAIESPELCVSG